MFEAVGLAVVKVVGGRLLLGALCLGLALSTSGARLFLVEGQSATGSTTTVTNYLSLGWNPSPSPSVSGYYLYWGLDSGECTNRLDVGGSTNATVGGLETQLTYYFTVVAYDDRGDASPPSNEVSYTMPTSPSFAAPLKLNIEMRLSDKAAPALQLSFEGTAGTTYQLQATEDFEHWETVGITNSVVDGPLVFNLTDLAEHPRRFFRLSR